MAGLGELVQEFVGDYGYWAIFLLIAIENLFPPIPSEIILTFGGFMTTTVTTSRPLNIGVAILVATIGAVVGAIALYLVGRFFNQERLGRWIDGKLGKYLRLTRDDLNKAQGWFDKHGNKTIFICRFIPLIRSLISIPAGMAKMKMAPFLILTTIGTAIWNTVLIFLGHFAGRSWDKIAAIFDKFSTVAVVVMGIAFLAGIFFFYRSKMKKKNAAKKDGESK